MAFKPKSYAGANPTGDKAFNAITKIVHGAPDGDDAPPAPAPAAKKPAAKGKAGKPKMRYNTATNAFEKC